MGEATQGVDHFWRKKTDGSDPLVRLLEGLSFLDLAIFRLERGGNICARLVDVRVEALDELPHLAIRYAVELRQVRLRILKLGGSRLEERDGAALLGPG